MISSLKRGDAAERGERRLILVVRKREWGRIARGKERRQKHIQKVGESTSCVVYTKLFSLHLIKIYVVRAAEKCVSKKS